MNRRAFLLAEVVAALAVATIAMGVVTTAYGWRRIESAQDQRAALLEVAQNRLAVWRKHLPLPTDPQWTVEERQRTDGIDEVVLVHRGGLRLVGIRATRRVQP
jgi:hypothetical protein